MYVHPRSLFSPPFSTPVVLSAHKLRSPCKLKTLLSRHLLRTSACALHGLHYTVGTIQGSIMARVFFINSF